MHCFSRPLDGEALVRYINGKTFIWNPNGGRNGKGHWDVQATPSTGEVNNGAPPPVPPNVIAPSPPQGPAQAHLAADDISLMSQHLSAMSMTQDPDEKRLLLSLVSQRIEATKRQL